MSTSRKKSLPGFTLIEMVISLGIFSIIALAVAGTFASGFSTYKETRALSRNLESAQFAMNTLAKLLRTSTVISAGGTNLQTITFHEYSSSRCFQYRIHASSGASVLQARWYGTVDFANCTTSGFGGLAYTDVTTGYVTGGFLVVPSANSPNIPTIGRVTINLSVKTNASAVREAHVQTTASLREYKEVGF